VRKTLAVFPGNKASKTAYVGMLPRAQVEKINEEAAS